MGSAPIEPNGTPEKTNAPLPGSYLERLGHLEREAFTHSTLACLLQLDAAKMMRLGDMLNKSVVAKLLECSSAEGIDRARPGLEMLLKIWRQSDRYIRLSVELQDG